MRPLRIKASGTPITSSNYQGLQEMSDSEIQQYLSYVLTNKFATDTDGTGTAELNVDTANALSGTSIGTFVDTERTEAIGTHPATGSTTSTTYYFKQVTSAASESITNRLVGYDTGSVKEMTDSDLDTDVLDKVISDMVSESDYTVGQYSLAASAPTGGTWTSRYTITDSALSGDNVKYLWQKTAPTSSANSDYASLKYASGLKMMTSAEIEQMAPNFRNRIIDSSIGTYKLQATAPATGTWVQMGDNLTDTRQEVTSQNYSGAYSGDYAGAYTGAKTYSGAYSGSYDGNYVGSYTGAKTYTGTYDGTYSGDYSGNYVGTSAYSGSYSGAYSGDYSGNYVGTSAYSGAYSGSYTGAYTGAYILYYAGVNYGSFSGTYSGAYAGTYTGYYTGAKTYTGTYTGSYTGSYTGYYTGPKTYTGTYTGAYTGTYTGNYVGTSAYSGTYTGTYTGSYTGNYVGTSAYSGTYTGSYTGSYAGDTVQATTETVTTLKLWLRTA